MSSSHSRFSRPKTMIHNTQMLSDNICVLWIIVFGLQSSSCNSRLMLFYRLVADQEEGCAIYPSTQMSTGSSSKNTHRFRGRFRGHLQQIPCISLLPSTSLPPVLPPTSISTFLHASRTWAVPSARPSTHLLAHLPTHLRTYPPIYPPYYPPTYPPTSTYLPTHTPTHLPTHHLPTHHLPTYPPHLPTHPSTYPLTYLPTYPPTL